MDVKRVLGCLLFGTVSTGVYSYTLPKCSSPSVIFPFSPDVPACEGGDIVPIGSIDDSICDTQVNYTLAFNQCCEPNIDNGATETWRYAELPPPLEEACVERMFLKPEVWLPAKLDACCKSCKCYGDPHCRSFDKKKDEWVNCDTRVPTGDGQCKPTGRNTNEHKNECYGGPGSFFKENKRGQCKFYASSTWDWANKGSRCQVAPGYTFSMTMYYDADIDFRVELKMGERGIIERVVVTDAGTPYILDSKDGAEGCMRWRSNGEIVQPANAKSQMVTDPATGFEDVWWTYEQAGTKKPIVRVQCMGYQRSRVGIDRRINLKIDQAAPVIDALSSESKSFCVDDKITEKSREKSIYCNAEGMPEWVEWNRNCKSLTQKHCKGGSGYPKSQADFSKLWRSQQHSKMIKIFQQCSKEWCSSRNLPDDVSLEECVDDVADFKFLGASGIYPQVAEQGTDADPEDCKAFANPGPKPESDECIEGVDFRVESESSPGTWESIVWIPLDNYCLIELRKEDFPELFTKTVRIYQNKCNDFGQRCNAWSTFEGKLSYASDCRELQELLELGELAVYEKGCFSEECKVDFQWSKCNPPAEEGRLLSAPTQPMLPKADE